MSLIFPWIRLNRIIRDIPCTYSLNSEYDSGLRGSLSDMLNADGLSCQCIRCREIKERSYNENYRVITREYNASDGIELFIEAQHENILYGFCRLRYNPEYNDIFPELNGCTMIRELHVYGNLLPVGDSGKSCNTQHKGIGRILVNHAVSLTKKRFKLSGISVISGEGTREYYKKLGFKHSYSNKGRFLIKEC